MTYLLTKILICLLLAGLLGLFLGWLFRGFRTATVLQQNEGEWKQKLFQSEKGAVALKSGLEKSNHEVTKLQTRYNDLVNDHKAMADEFAESNTMAERIRILLKQEREKSQVLEKQYVKKSQLLSHELSTLNAGLEKAESELEEAQNRTQTNLAQKESQKTTITDLNQYLELEREKLGNSQEEVHRLEKAFSDSVVAISDRDQAIELLEAQFAEQELLLKQQADQLNSQSVDNEALLSKLSENEGMAQVGSEELRELQLKFDEAEDKARTLKELNQKYTSDYTSAANYKNEVEQLKKIILEKDQKFDQVEETLASAYEQFDEEKKSLRSILDSTQDQLQTQVNSNNELEQTLIEVQKQYDDREHVLEQTQQRLMVVENHSTDNLVDLQQENTEQTESLKSLQQENDQLVRNLENEEEIKLKLLETIQSQRDELNELNTSKSSEPEGEETSDGKPKSYAAPRSEGADDLKRISGVGPKIEGILNDLGIYHFDQIGRFNKSNIDWVNEHLRFKGRIEREEWVAQAKALSLGEATEFSNRYDKS